MIIRRSGARLTAKGVEEDFPACVDEEDVEDDSNADWGAAEERVPDSCC